MGQCYMKTRMIEYEGMKGIFVPSTEGNRVYIGESSFEPLAVNKFYDAIHADRNKIDSIKFDFGIIDDKEFAKLVASPVYREKGFDYKENDYGRAQAQRV